MKFRSSKQSPTTSSLATAVTATHRKVCALFQCDGELVFHPGMGTSGTFQDGGIGSIDQSSSRFSKSVFRTMVRRCWFQRSMVFVSRVKRWSKEWSWDSSHTKTLLTQTKLRCTLNNRCLFRKINKSNTEINRSNKSTIKSSSRCQTSFSFFRTYTFNTQLLLYQTPAYTQFHYCMFNTTLRFTALYCCCAIFCTLPLNSSRFEYTGVEVRVPNRRGVNVQAIKAV